MSIVEILYIILGACIVVITVTIVWLANETIKLVKSLRKSSDDVAFMTQEVKEKVLVVTEALDRAGTAATNIIGFIEDAIEGIKQKRDQLSDSIGLVSGVGEYFKKNKESKIKDKEEEEVPTTEGVEKEEEVEEEKPKKKPSKPKKRAEKVKIEKVPTSKAVGISTASVGKDKEIESDAQEPEDEKTE